MCQDVLLIKQHFRALGGKFVKRDINLLLCIQIDELLLQTDKQVHFKDETIIGFGASSEVVDVLYFTFFV